MLPRVKSLVQVIALESEGSYKVALGSLSFH